MVERRSGGERRRFSYTSHVPERRSGRDRRGIVEWSKRKNNPIRGNRSETIERRPNADIDTASADPGAIRREFREA